MRSVMVPGYVEGLFEQTEVRGETVGTFEAARCKACGEVFVCEPEKVPAHECHGLSETEPTVVVVEVKKFSSKAGKPRRRTDRG